MKIRIELQSIVVYWNAQSVGNRTAVHYLESTYRPYSDSLRWREPFGVRFVYWTAHLIVEPPCEIIERILTAREGGGQK